jgi:hypothetical protein
VIADRHDLVPVNIAQQVPAQVILPVIVYGQHGRDPVLLRQLVQAFRMIRHKIVEIMRVNDFGLLRQDEVFHHVIYGLISIRACRLAL